MKSPTVSISALYRAVAIRTLSGSFSPSRCHRRQAETMRRRIPEASEISLSMRLSSILRTRGGWTSASCSVNLTSNGMSLIKNKSTASGGETPKGSAVPSVVVRRSSVRKALWGRRTAMKDWQSQAHVKWDCKYHVVILPKYRRKVMYGKMRRGIGQILRDLCRQKHIEL